MTAATRGGASAPLLDRYFADQTELEAIQTDRAALGDVASRLRTDDHAADDLLVLPVLTTRAPEVRTALVDLGTKQAALDAARQQYTDEHKTVRDLRRAEERLRLETIPRLASARSDQLARRERELRASVAATTTALRGIPARTLEDLRLRRNVSLAEQLFASVQTRHEAARLAESGMVSDVSLLDSAAAPTHAPRTRAAQLSALFAGAGALGGILVALLADGTDKRLRYEAQVGEDLELPVLGTVPRLRAQRSAHSLASAQLVESLRSIRASISYATRGESPTVLTITSPNMRDGKSLVSANLAISFAEAGHRTLLIDGDVRRGELNALFECARRPGLSDCLASGLSLGSALKSTNVPNLTLLPSGTRYRQGPELLAGPALSDLIAEARQTYDVIVVDSAPLGAGSDALWTTVATGAVALVLRLNASDRKLAKAKLHVLDQLSVKVLGVVLNDCVLPEQDEYADYLRPDLCDEDTAVPQLTSRVGVTATR